jgi:DNA-binding XRE family transcriptional regulator
MKMITAIGSCPEMTKPRKRDLQRLVGRRIRVARKNAGLFQRELAERVGVSRNQITSVELGVSDTGFTVIIDIARAVGVKTRQLLP